jgi:hypothetical protein
MDMTKVHTFTSALIFYLPSPMRAMMRRAGQMREIQKLLRRIVHVMSAFEIAFQASSRTLRAIYGVNSGVHGVHGVHFLSQCMPKKTSIMCTRSLCAYAFGRPQ